MAPRELLAQGDWTGYGGKGDYKDSNGNTKAVMNASHQIRNGVFDAPPSNAVDTGETFDCVIVGGGISGLAGALAFTTRTGQKLTSLVLENHPIFGGEAKRNEFVVDGQTVMGPQGSDHFQIPYPYSFIADFYRRIGINWRDFQYQTWGSSEPPVPLGRTFEAMPSPVANYYGAKFKKRPGIWLVDPKLADIPIPDEMRNELIAYHSKRRHAKKPFVFPGDPEFRRLDSMMLEEHLMEFGLSRTTIRTLMTPGDAGGFGAGPDVVSAYCAYAFDELHALDDTPETGWRAFPGGNAGIARHIVKTLIPDSIHGPPTLEAISRNQVNFPALDRPGQSARLRLGSTAVRVEHGGKPEQSEFVRVTYTKDGKVYRLKARSVVMAGGCWTTKLVVRDLPEAQKQAYSHFSARPASWQSTFSGSRRPLTSPFTSITTIPWGASSLSWFSGSHLRCQSSLRCISSASSLG